MGWKDKLNAIVPKGTDREIRGSTWKFYPSSFRMLFKIKPIAKSLGKTMAMLLADRQTDQGFISKEMETSPETSLSKPTLVGGGRMKESQTLPISPELAKQRVELRGKNLDQLFDELLDERNKLIIAELICDSLRDEFPRPTPQATLETFSDDWSIVDMVEFLMGTLTANKDALGPLMKGLPLSPEKLAERIKENNPSLFSTMGNTG